MECIEIVLWRVVEGADQRNLRLSRSTDAQLKLKLEILDAMNSLTLCIFFSCSTQQFYREVKRMNSWVDPGLEFSRKVK